MVTADEQRALQLENAEADLRFWDRVADMHAGTAEDHKGLAATAERKAAEGETERGKAAEHAARAKDRIARIERGEDVQGGLGKPLTCDDFEHIMREAGMTKADIRRCEDVSKIYQAGGEQLLFREVMKRKERAERRTIRDVLRLIEWAVRPNITTWLQHDEQSLNLVVRP